VFFMLTTSLVVLQYFNELINGVILVRQNILVQFLPNYYPPNCQIILFHQNFVSYVPVYSLN